MRTFLKFVALLAGALLLAAVLTYPCWRLVEMISDQPVHRVMHRLAMLFALLGLVCFVRRQGLGYAGALGYGLSLTRFIRQLAYGYLWGLALLLPLMAILFALELRVPREHALTLTHLLPLIGSGVVAGLVVAFIEETFFRGILQSAVERESDAMAAIALPSLLYASLHFLGGRLRLPDAEVDWTAGFTVLAKLFEKYAAPFSLIDSFLALFAVGVLLALIRQRTGAIAAGIGLHASWVMLIAVTRGSSTDNQTNSQDWLTGSYDGVIGWGALFWTALILGVALARWRRRPMSTS
ncbi:MAG: CPBP family intramembrane glutamic endopeptidase [Steroidobacteraceae bacterium]